MKLSSGRLSANPFVSAQITGHDENFKNPQSYQFGFAMEKDLRADLSLALIFPPGKDISGTLPSRERAFLFNPARRRRIDHCRLTR
jgi:hypothetical protein